jgi:hypothetical protein
MGAVLGLFGGWVIPVFAAVIQTSVLLCRFISRMSVDPFIAGAVNAFQSENPWFLASTILSLFACYGYTRWSGPLPTILH